ncbi:MAG: hypothetical protein L3J67_02165 [Hyphomicrobiaceae bacterium]|nr:hypothetical protein [Hyphomicrobiaceae bacterium]
MINTKKSGELIVRVVRKIVLLGFAGASLAACTSSVPSIGSTASNSLTSSSPGLDYVPPAKVRIKNTMITRSAKPVRMTMAPVVGPPAAIAKKLNARIASELKKRNIKVVRGKTGYNMRGYVVSSSEGSGAKLAYIWDLRNKAGHRKHRITGEKTVAGGRSKNPWAGVNDRIVNAIAVDTAEQLAGWLGNKNGGAVRTASTRRLRSKRANHIPVNSRTSRTTASRGAGKRVIMAMVMPVSGAPGDGKTSLTKAIKDRLYKKGIRLTSKRTDSVYQVRGVVQLANAGAGKQKIRIDWRVYDPKGKRLGTVTQKNEIPKGSLNGSWGPIADAAAGAAADGITKLLPKTALRVSSR